MVGSALKLLRDELSSYVFRNKRQGDNILEEDVVLRNISLIESDDTVDFKNKVVLTLVNIEEESTLKNGHNVVRTYEGMQYVEPPVYLNLYVLISTTQGTGSSEDGYEKSLNRLSLIIQYFQSKRHFTIKNSPFTTVTDDDNLSEPSKSEIRLNVELYTLTFEQINHLWGSLGGKQIPFVMYKVRLVKIQEDLNGIKAPLIETIETSQNSIMC